MLRDINSKSMNDFLESSPEPTAKMPNLSSHTKGPTVVENKREGIPNVVVNPITGHTRHFVGYSSVASMSGSPRGEQDRQSLIDFDPVNVRAADSRENSASMLQANKARKARKGPRGVHGSIA